MGAEVKIRSTEDSLFVSEDLLGLRARWNDVQAGFVDDPRKCVQSADGLVSDVVQQPTDGFTCAPAAAGEVGARRGRVDGRSSTGVEALPGVLRSPPRRLPLAGRVS